MPKILDKELKEKKAKKVVEKGKATETKAVKKDKVIKDEKNKKVDKVDNKKVTNKVTSNKTTKSDKVTKNSKTTEKKSTKTTAKSVAKKETSKSNKSVAKNTKKAISKNKKKIDPNELENSKKLITEYLQEYYDLPYRYNETVVTILAQTPKRLFVYWDISDKDREAYRKAFGDDFFEKTYPVLLVHNEELDYTFEVPINDFANSWYLDIQDSKKNYVVQLGRKFKNINQVQNINYEVLKDEKINLQNDFIYITGSNRLEAPNDHILFETLPDQITYRNVKDGSEFKKNIKDLVDDAIKTYPAEAVHDLYTKLYSEEIAREEFVRKNPGSGEFGGLPTSSGAVQW